MKLFICIAFIVVAFLAYTAQAQRCPSEPRQPTCRDNMNEGMGGRGCWPRIMYYYNRNQRRCMQMRYRGCGGNGNRYCTMAECTRRCR